MPLSHLLIGLSIVFIWGTNFVVIKWGLADFPPFLFATLRFTLSALPWLFFIRRPKVSWGKLATFGVFHGVGQFGLLFLAMRHDITPGLASLVVQAQVFFTIGMAMLLKGERIKPLQVLALLLAVAGIGVIALRIAGDTSTTVTMLGLLLVLGAAFSWAVCNLTVRSAGRVDALGFMVWSSVFAIPPLLALSLFIEGPTHIASAFTQASFGGWSAVIWQAVANSLFGYGAWNWLLARHPAATVTPLALLAPVFGMTASALLLAEPLPPWKLAAAALVLGALLINMLASRPSRVTALDAALD
ncbi:EamA family transporter [Herbaspirillum sp. RTI4]|uniref:EamA family transporter n=1 Tax=Herbaspirillum sp. RTI4 TaxID=3048640 RepID=UPI002AB41B5E|nr:EamA family transporter [Herbaspirillum sp. RTI4]MDY7579329.1 EamA family transporter [Herbaspirillum sp. RTI4]MEA9980243.1 EamA family transporter [Herbaspirillum sp. RTI4]